MARLPDWDARLFAVVEAHEGAAFVWGHADCFTFAMACVEAVTGANPYADEAGRWRSAAGARRRLRARGFGSIEAAIAAVFPEIPPALAQRGDLAIVHGAHETVTVSLGARFLSLAPAGGLAGVRLDHVSKAFRVG